MSANSEMRRTKIEVSWAAIAWADSSLVMVTAIDKQDFHLLGKFITLFTSSPETLSQDPKPFASVALLLNCIALAFTALPLLPLRKDTEEKTIVRAFELHENIFSGIGATLWGLSFFAFLIYLNDAIALATLIAFFISFFWIAIACSFAKKQ